jgi:hypothetical protein
MEERPRYEREERRAAAPPAEPVEAAADEAEPAPAESADAEALVEEYAAPTESEQASEEEGA